LLSLSNFPSSLLFLLHLPSSLLFWTFSNNFGSCLAFFHWRLWCLLLPGFETKVLPFSFLSFPRLSRHFYSLNMCLFLLSLPSGSSCAKYRFVITLLSGVRKKERLRWSSPSSFPLLGLRCLLGLSFSILCWQESTFREKKQKRNLTASRRVLHFDFLFFILSLCEFTSFQVPF
jgi:hypothetical protein